MKSLNTYIVEGLRINKSNIKDININNCAEDLINHFLLDVFLKDNFINKSEYDEACEKIEKYVNDNNIKNITFYSSVKKDYLSYIPDNIIGDLIMNSNGSPDDFFMGAVKDLFVNGSTLFVNDESYIKLNKKNRIKIRINPPKKIYWYIIS